MTKVFYDHLIIFEEIIAMIDDHKPSPKHRKELVELVDTLFHQHVLDEILTTLPKSHHKEFLALFLASPNNPQLIPFLNEHTGVDIEKSILYRANKVKRNVQKLIRKTHKTSKA